MRIFGGIYLNEDGLSTSLRGMSVQTSILGTLNENIYGFNKIGYQRKMPVVSSFVELLGTHALSNSVDTTPGRIIYSEKPLDIALASKGYFQYQSKEGIQLTRDGRFKLDKDGNLLTLSNDKVLSINGTPIKFNEIPKDLTDIQIDNKGQIFTKDSITKTAKFVDQLAVVSSEGSLVSNVDVKQGYNEASNVPLHQEFFNLIPVRRNFEANRELFIMQNEQLTKTIQSLGSTS